MGPSIITNQFQIYQPFYKQWRYKKWRLEKQIKYKPCFKEWIEKYQSQLHSHGNKTREEENLGHDGSTISFNLSKLRGIWKSTNQESAIRVPIRLIFCSHFHSSWPQHAPLRIHKPWKHKNHPFLSINQ